MPTVEYSTYTSKSTIWVLAQRDPSFEEFYLQYQDQIVLPTPLSVDFWDDVIAIAEKEPDLSSAVKRCRENTQSAQSFAIPGLPEIGGLIAALFLLRTHIKIHRTEDGKWEFLVEHSSSNDSALEKIACLWISSKIKVSKVGACSNEKALYRNGYRAFLLSIFSVLPLRLPLTGFLPLCGQPFIVALHPGGSVFHHLF